MKNKLISFEFLRAIAIILILVTHSTSYLNWKFFKYSIAVFNPFFAQIGLSLFIFISGYLIYINNSDVFYNKKLLSFYKKRVFRIFPLYWLALIIFMITFNNMKPLLAQQFIVPDTQELFGFNNIIYHMFGLQILMAPNYSTPIFTLYFVGLILMFYSIYPFINSESIVKIYYKMFFIYLCSIVATLFLKIIDQSFFTFYFIFMAGVIFAKIGHIDKQQYTLLLPLVPTILVALAILNDRIFLYTDPRISITAISDSSGSIGTSTAYSIINQISSMMNLTNTSVEYTLVFIPFVLLSILFCLFTLLFSNDLNNENLPPAIQKGIINISYCSYSLYLFHRPFLTIVSSLLAPLELSPIIKDGLILVLAIPLLYSLCYHIQKIDSNISKKIMKQIR